MECSFRSPILFLNLLKRKLTVSVLLGLQLKLPLSDGSGGLEYETLLRHGGHHENF